MQKIFKILNGLYTSFPAITILVIGLLTNNVSHAQNELDVIHNNWLQFSDASNSMYHYLTEEAFKLLDSRVEKISQFATLDEWKKRQSQVREAMWNVLGTFPEKTPLNAKITGRVKKNGYKIENVIYESLPGFYVTASIFIPDNSEKPAPAILFCSGHSTGVYRLPYYQLPLLNLVKKGFIVLAIDPIGQGERLQYFNPETGESIIGSSTKEHSYPSAQVSLIGESIARYFIWDGIRGIDYLISRKEVDPKRIGVHGLSGGGTQTAYISALDDRVTASAPAGYITSFKRLMESIGVQDGEQNFYHGISEGIDHADFIEARAPKPTLIMATTNDFFSYQGTRETYSEAKRIFELFGKPDNIEITEDFGDHGYTKKNREAMYAFFQKHLMLPGSSAEEEVDFPTSQELQKTSTGQVSASIGGESVFSQNCKDSEKYLKKLQESRNYNSDYLLNVIVSAKKLSGYIDPSFIDKPVFSGRIKKENYVIEKYFVKGNGSYVIPYVLFVPVKPNNNAVVYLHPSGKTAVASEEEQIEWFVNEGFTVLAPDLLGIGEMGPGIFKGDAYIENTSYNMWYTAMQIGRSIVGVQAADVVKLTRVLKQNHGINDIYGVAKKEMSPLLLHAAAFDTNIARIALIEPYSSYSLLVRNRFYKTNFVHSIVPGALTAYDLPDLAATLAPRKLMIAAITDENGKQSDNEDINKDIDVIRKSYQRQNAENHLDILLLSLPEKLNDLFGKWIR